MQEKADRRADPRALWPEARTVVVLGLNYGPERNPLEEADDGARISVYARHRDYHDVLKKRLKALGRWIAETHQTPVKVFVDTAPVMEKPLAQAGGIGWQGQAHQPRLAAIWGPGSFSARCSWRSTCPPTIRRAIIAASAGAVSMPARPRPSPRPIASMRGAADLLPHHRTQRADPAGAAAVVWATGSMAATIVWAVCPLEQVRAERGLARVAAARGARCT